VLNNEDLNMVTWEMRAMAGIPKFEATQRLPSFDYARHAELAGLTGIRVEKPDDVADAWDRALGADRPVVIDVLTDPEVPPLPPHVNWEQGRSLVKAVLQGDPGARDMIKQTFKGKVQELLPHR
jgi:pyruvate dehydrogenase (quinone)